MIRSVFFLSAVLGGFLLFLTSWNTTDEGKLLVFAKNAANQTSPARALTALALRSGLTVDTTSNIAYLTEDSLKKYRTVVLVNASPDGFEIGQQNDLERFVQAGGGLALLSAGPVNPYQWRWYHDLTRTDSSQLWSREYDGGRVFFAANGGTVEKYGDEAFGKSMVEGLRYALGSKALSYQSARTLRVPEENRFTVSVLDSYMYEPIEMEVLADGRVLFIERRGAVKLYDPAQKATRVINNLPVNILGNYEDGLLGMELDPQFEQNHFVYLYYSPVGKEPVQHLSRFVFNGDSLLPSSEKVVMKVPVQRETCCHSAGNVYFAKDGNLYLSTGDNTSSKESDGFSPLDERPGRAPFDAQKSSGNANDMRGKILRIHVESDGSYTIPDGNLFPKDGSQGRPEIYVMGARNPYRIWVDKRGFLYWGDVGPDGGTANERGPKSHDEWNQARKPGNFGWPYFVGDNKAYADFDFATNKVGPLFNPEQPLNESPNNTGSKTLPPAQKPMIWYPYDKSVEFPMLGLGSRSAMAGPFYYAEAYRASNAKFPAYFNNKMFIYEWARSWIKLLTFNDAGDLQQIESFLPTTFVSKPIDMKFGPDGAMYVLAYGVNYFARNPDSQLLRIEYTEGNRRPVAKIAAPTLVGAAPFTAKLSAKQSFDYDRGDRVSYQWTSGHGQSSSAAEPVFRYTKPGVYRAKLTVTDAQGEKATTETVLKVGNETPRVGIVVKGNRSFYFDNSPIAYQVTVRDKEDGVLNKGILPKQVKFAVDYLAEGKDLALLASNSQSTGDVSVKYLSGKTLVNTSDCKACHAMSAKSIGPSYLDVARRYKSTDEAAVTMLAKKIITGGNGNWGQNMMAAHPQHTGQETTDMIRYILSLNQAASASLPLQGTYTFKEQPGNKQTGTYVVTASYTDKGNAYTGPLTGRNTVLLRNPKVEAESFEMSKSVDRKHRDGTDLTVVGDIKNGSYIGFKALDLTGVRQLIFNASPVAKGGQIEVRAGSPSGKLLGTATVTPPPTPAGSATPARRGYQWQKVTTPLETPTGVTDLFFV
ncbi:MAG: PQQ-dependent sugar dehydrogenase, partial [Cytophagaceae bacterium]|nr:PQQ-dependent sugar dehydrogenase [Cytophagaceae bacterium]